MHARISFWEGAVQAVFQAHASRQTSLYARHAQSQLPLWCSIAGVQHACAAQCTALGSLRASWLSHGAFACILKPQRARAGWVFSDNAVVVTTLAQILVFVAVAIVGDGVNAVQVRNYLAGSPAKHLPVW